MQKLNTQQEKAVEAIDGPVLVIAGPGTGKTQLLSARVANILKKTDALGDNILCLTFTEKAAVNMRERLLKLVGQDASRVQIKTFHAFGSEIINTHSEYFYNGRNVRPVPDAASINIIENILSKLPVSSSLSSKSDGRYVLLSSVQNAISRAKAAGLTPEKLRVLAMANIAYIDKIESQLVEICEEKLSRKNLESFADKISNLPDQYNDAITSPIISLSTKIKDSLIVAIAADRKTTKASNTSSWKRKLISNEGGSKGLHRERKANQRWLEIAGVYESYQSDLLNAGYFDYDDMIIEVVGALESNDSLLAELQEQYQYILIDEFQDSNAAQMRLAHLVAEHPSNEGRPNIMAVGDDDQSIYGFSGAELDNMLHFSNKYGKDKTKTIVLHENYRSSINVLKAAQGTIEQCNDRLINRLPGLTKDLTPSNKEYANTKSVIEHRRYMNPANQYIGLVDCITKFKATNPDKTVVVLARKHTSLQEAAKVLAANEIPIYYEQTENILDNEAVRLILLIIRTVQAINLGNQEEVSEQISQLAKHPACELDPKELWEIAIQNRFKMTWLETMLERENTTELAEWLMWLSIESSYQPLPQMFEYLLGLGDETPNSPVSRYINKQKITPHYLQTLNAVHILRGIVNDFASSSHPTLADLLKYVDLKIANNQAINNPWSYVSGENPVQLMTAHKSKGLEFDRVYIIDAIEQYWKPTGSRDITSPSNLPLKAPLESPDDYARLMYVAISRAHTDVIITSYFRDSLGKELLPTPLIAHFPERKIENYSFDQNINYIESSLHAWPRISISEEKNLLSNIFETFSINPTNLINFLDITNGGPQTFLERNLLRLPTAKTDYMRHGTAMHAALEYMQKQINSGMTPPLKDLQREYARALSLEHMHPQDYKRQLEYGKEVLGKLVNEFNYTLTKGSQPEQSLSNILVGDARISGKLDRIDYIDSETLRIVDYKTGKALSSFDTKDKTKEVKAWKHKLQLTFYALLARNHPKLQKYTTIKGQMAYIEADQLKHIELEYIPTPEEIDQLSKVIQVVWKSIMNMDLPDTSIYEPSLGGIELFIDDLLSRRKSNV